MRRIALLVVFLFGATFCSFLAGCAENHSGVRLGTAPDRGRGNEFTVLNNIDNSVLKDIAVNGRYVQWKTGKDDLWHNVELNTGEECSVALSGMNVGANGDVEIRAKVWTKAGVYLGVAVEDLVVDSGYLNSHFSKRSRTWYVEHYQPVVSQKGSAAAHDPSVK